MPKNPPPWEIIPRPLAEIRLRGEFLCFAEPAAAPRIIAAMEDASDKKELVAAHAAEMTAATSTHRRREIDAETIAQIEAALFLAAHAQANGQPPTIAADYLRRVKVFPGSPLYERVKFDPRFSDDDRKMILSLTKQPRKP